MLEKRELEAIKNLLVKKGIITQEEIKEESDRILKQQWLEDDDSLLRHTY